MKRTATTYLGLLMLVPAFMLTFVACERGESPTSEGPTATAVEVSKDERETESDESGEADLSAANKGAERGESCRVDHTCRTYLRCLEGVCEVPGAMTGQVVDDTPSVQFSLNGEQVASFHIELAVSDAEKQRGLMYRPRMKDDWGMLFVYERDGPRSFWMKNTLIPLDMVFINDAGTVVGIIEGAEPMTLEPRRVDEPARFVLELNAGIAARSGIVKGAKMELEDVEESLRPARK